MSEPAGAAREINDALAAGRAQTRRPRPQSGLAAAFIKACKLIYDIIMFFVDNAERILKFVNTVIDSAVDIVRGNVGGVVAKIEDVLGQMVPILIGFLASAIGIGGIGEKIREIIATLQKPINKAIDFVIKTGLKLAGPIIRGLKGIGSKVKAKVAAGKAWVKGKAEAGKKWVKGKVTAVGEALGIVAKPFSVGRDQHTLDVDTRTGSIAMASRQRREVSRTIAQEVADVNERRQAAGLPPIPEGQVTARILPHISAARERINAAKQGKSAEAKAQLDHWAEVVSEVLAQIGAGAKTEEAGPTPGIGSIAPHSENSGRVRRDPNRPWAGLESEHVIPVALISDLFHTLGDDDRIRRGDAEDNIQHTILVYKEAAR